MSIAVSIVVPVHNRASLTRSCLDAVLADLPADCEIVVVDDASTDATPDLLAGYGNSIEALTLPANRGYAGACNEGARAAQGEAL
ncbi:MAG: glycosyltransferase family 2 protein, partial [Thermoleophilia bacterium]